MIDDLPCLECSDVGELLAAIQTLVSLHAMKRIGGFEDDWLWEDMTLWLEFVVRKRLTPDMTKLVDDARQRLADLHRDEL